jgi:hypothetical protein
MYRINSHFRTKCGASVHTAYRHSFQQAPSRVESSTWRLLDRACDVCGWCIELDTFGPWAFIAFITPWSGRLAALTRIDYGMKPDSYTSVLQ